MRHVEKKRVGQDKEDRKQLASRKSHVPKRPTAAEEAYMRKVSLHFVIGFCITSEFASLAAFFIGHSLEGAALFQVPALLLFYKILSYLFPGPDSQDHPLVLILRALIKQ